MVGRILLLALFLAGTLWPQQDQGKQPPKPKTPEQTKPQPTEQEPPEEDESLAPKVYPFNPLEAEHDLKVGNYYFKKGNFKAALNRFREATRFNPSFAEAYLRLGDSEEKLKDKAAANQAYAKFLELAPDAKEAEAVKKKLAGQR
jgi:tetratricopeptide (TPR) repeat protein